MTLGAYNPKDVPQVTTIRKYRASIITKHKEAVSNADFLGILEGPVNQIHNVPMEGLPKLFADIYSYIFIIWDNSLYYNNQ